MRIWPLVFSFLSLNTWNQEDREWFIGSNSFFHTQQNRIFLPRGANQTSLKRDQSLPRLLSTSIRCFIPLAMLWVSRYSSMHVRTKNKPGCSLFFVRRTYSSLLMLKVTPQFRHFASTLPGLGSDDTMRLPYSITCSDKIIKRGNAPVPCQFLYCFIMLALHEQASFRKRTWHRNLQRRCGGNLVPGLLMLKHCIGNTSTFVLKEISPGTSPIIPSQNQKRPLAGISSHKSR